MPSTKHKFVVKASPHKLAELLFSARQLGTVFHPVQSTEGDDNRSQWRLKPPFRATLGTSHLDAEILSRSENECAWQARSAHLTWQGRLKVLPISSEEATVELDLTIEDTGPLAAVHNTMISVQIKNVAKLFEKNLRETVETSDD